MAKKQKSRGLIDHTRFITVELEGGLIQAIRAIAKGTKVIVLDWDIEGAGDDVHIIKWRDEQGQIQEAFASVWEPGQCAKMMSNELTAIVKQMKKKRIL